jgi:transcriptional regulator with XRE-family HTH domain
MIKANMFNFLEKSEQQPKTPEQQYKNLCEQLQYYRKKRNISQKNLAALTNTHAISRVERGYLRVRIDTFVKIVDGLGLDIILRPKDEIPF